MEETLKWSDVAKTGNKVVRKNWLKKGYDLFCHNLGSAAIYKENNHDEIVYTLIKTHGLIGQYLKGEVNLKENYPLYLLTKNNLITKEKLKEVLLILNECILTGVSKELYMLKEKEIALVIEKIINGDFQENINFLEKFSRLNKSLSLHQFKCRIMELLILYDIVSKNR